jgi:hypothetical protein
MRSLFQYAHALTHFSRRSLSQIVQRYKNQILSVILVVGLVQGLIYTFAIPPWWHYDEPGHFEFAWQIVHFDHWPQFGEVDESMRRSLALSLLRFGYYDLLNYRPDLSSNEPVFIGAAPQTTKYPLYYLIASLPLRLLWSADFAVQNRAMRLMSLPMFLLTLWVAWKALGELLPEGHPIQWMTVLFMTLLPGLADTMTSINDDVGAVLVFSLFLWAALRMMRRGFSLGRLMALGLALSLCYWTKNTTWTAFVLAPIALLFSLFRARLRPLAWGLLVGGLVFAGFFALRWGDARYWYRGAAQDENTRLMQANAPLGNYVFHLRYEKGQTPWIGQFISVEQIRPLRAKTVTLGAWMWADQPVAVRFPTLRMVIYKGGVTYSPVQTVSLTTVPVFYSITFDVPSDAERGWLELIPAPSGSEGQNVRIYYDGLILTEGARDGVPRFDDPFAQSGTWDGQPFQNRLRGASAESAWIWLNPLIGRVLSKAALGSLDVFLASLQDWAGNRAYYQSVVSTLFRTFWAQPARNKVSLLGAPASYEVLQWLTALAMAGVIILLSRKAHSIPWAEVVFLSLSLASVWGATVVRGGGELLVIQPLIPWARYAFPAIIPTALLLCAGWWEGLHGLGRWMKSAPWQPGVIFVAFMLSLDIFALLSVTRYFYWKEGQEYIFLFLLMVFLLYLAIASIRIRLKEETMR